MAGCVKFIQINRGIIEDVELPGSCAKIRSVIKIRIFFFYPPIAGSSPEEENRQSEKLYSMLREISPANSSIRFPISLRVCSGVLCGDEQKSDRDYRSMDTTGRTR